MAISQISKKFQSGITPLKFTKELYKQYLVIEAYEVKNGLSPVIMNDVFQFGENSAYELRSGNHLHEKNKYPDCQFWQRIY